MSVPSSSLKQRLASKQWALATMCWKGSRNAATRYQRRFSGKPFRSFSKAETWLRWPKPVFIHSIRRLFNAHWAHWKVLINCFVCLFDGDLRFRQNGLLSDTVIREAAAAKAKFSSACFNSLAHPWVGRANVQVHQRDWKACGPENHFGAGRWSDQRTISGDPLVSGCYRCDPRSIFASVRWNGFEAQCDS